MVDIEFNKKVTEIISVRKSWRVYRNDRIEEVKKDGLIDICSTLSTEGPLGNKARFKLIETDKYLGKKLRGTYGLIHNPSHFIVGATQDDVGARVDYGFLLEYAVLSAVDSGLDTCWVGYFDDHDETFTERIGLEDGETIPAIIVLGYATGGKTVVEKGIRLLIKPHNRKRHEKLFYDRNFDTPVTKERLEEVFGDYAEALEMLRLGPSSGNTQPWMIVKRNEGTLDFYLKKVSGKYMKKGLHHIDMGVAACHFELTSRSNGLEGKFTKLDPDNAKLPNKTQYITSWVAD